MKHLANGQHSQDQESHHIHPQLLTDKDYKRHRQQCKNKANLISHGIQLTSYQKPGQKPEA